MALNPSRLYSALLNTGLQQKDNPLYQVIHSLIGQLVDISNSIRTGTIVSGGGSSVTILTQILTGSPGLDGIDGEDAIPVPGPKGIDGAAGISNVPGPGGPMGAIIFPPDADDGDSFPIPGLQGIQGITGAQGPIGPILLVEDGIDGEDGVPGPPGSSVAGAGNPWALISSFTFTGAETVKDFINLGAFTDILVILRAVTLTGSSEIRMRVSIDNGANFLSTSGDYVAFSSTGAEVNNTEIQFYTGSATAARTGVILISGFNLTAPKLAVPTGGISDRYIPTANGLNAVRIFNLAGTTFTGGTVYVLGR